MSRLDVARWALRGLVVLGALLAALDLPLGLAPGRARVVVLDRSRSLARGRAQVAAAGRAALADLGPRDRAAWVVVGADVATTPLAAPQDALAGLDAALDRPVDPRGTRLDLGLEAALAAGGPGAEVVLVSDGRDTSGRGLEAAAALAAAGARLLALAPDAGAPLGVRVSRVEVAGRAAAGARLPVRVEVEASDRRRVEVRLDVRLDGGAPGPAVAATGEAAPGAPLVVQLTTGPLPGPGLVRLAARARAAGQDDAPEDDALEAVVRTGGARRALVTGASAASVTLGAGLAAEVVAPGELGRALAEGPPPDLIVLADAPAAGLPVPALTAAVEAGAALVVAGCDRAFGPGGYAGAPLEALLPVTSGPGRERQRPLSAALALDASGSMGQALPGGGVRWKQAVEAALQEKDEGGALAPGDGLAVIAFAAGPTLERPLGPLRPGDVAALRTRLLAREATGPTDIGAGLLAALEALRAAPADGDRVVLLVTDSGDPRPEAHRAALEAAGRAAGAGLSVVALLVGVDEAQAASVRALLAALGLPAGAARVAPIADAGPALRDAVQGAFALARADRREGSFEVRPVVPGLALPARVAAFAPVQARPGAEWLALVVDPETAPPGADGPPLAALGRRGAGRVAALTFAPGPALAALGPALGDLLPPARDEATLEVRRRGDRLELALRGRDLPPLLVARAREAAGPGQASAPLVAPTTASASGWLPAPSAGPLDVVVSAGAGEKAGEPLALARVPGAAHDEAPPGALPDHALLAAMAAAGGGRVLTSLPPPPDAFGPPRGDGPRTGTPAALLALAALLLDAGLAALGARRSGRPAPPLRSPAHG